MTAPARQAVKHLLRRCVFCRGSAPRNKFRAFLHDPNFTGPLDPREPLLVAGNEEGERL